MTRTDELPRTFATLRFSGPHLDPTKISAIMPVPPKRAHRRGEVFRAGDIAGTARGQTGIWYTDTREMRSRDGIEHMRRIAELIGDRDHINRLRAVMYLAGAVAHVSWYWYGAPGERPPVLPDDIRRVLDSLPTSIETEFATDPVAA